MPPLVRPNLKPRRAALWILSTLFAIWVALLAWIYVTQVWMKHA